MFGGLALGCVGVRYLRHSLSKRSARSVARDAARAASNSFRIALCQLLISDDKEQNLQDAAAAIRDASKKGAHIVTLPECFQSPYATDQFGPYAETVPEVGGEVERDAQPSMAMLHDEAVRNNIYIVGGSVPERSGDKIFNTCVVFGPDGSIVAKHRKMHLFDIDIPGKITFRESDTLTGGREFSHFDFVKPTGKGEQGGVDVKCRIGIGVCYDMRFAELAQIQRANGCDVLIYPGAFNTTTGCVNLFLMNECRPVLTPRIAAL